MSTNKQYAQQLKEIEGYERDIIAFKLCDETPEGVASYGDDQSFLCAIAAEVWEEDSKPFYITNENVMCGGSVYSSLGMKRVEKEEFDAAMEMVIGEGKAYATREVFRSVNQQLPHLFHKHKYMVIGRLEEVQDPDMVMIVADANKVMRLCKVYTWKTGDLVQGLQGTAWCAGLFPLVLWEQTMSFNLGDPPSRVLMQLEDGEMYCCIHYSLLPMIIENLKNISDGMVM